MALHLEQCAKEGFYSSPISSDVNDASFVGRSNGGEVRSHVSNVNQLVWCASDHIWWPKWVLKRMTLEARTEMAECMQPMNSG